MDQSGSESSLGMRQVSTCIRRLSPDGVMSPSAILAFSASSKTCANSARSTAEKYEPTEARIVESTHCFTVLLCRMDVVSLAECFQQLPRAEL